MNLWKYADKLRSSGKRFTMRSLVDFATSSNVTITSDDLIDLAKRLDPFDPLAPPKLVTQTILELTYKLKHKKALDPWGRIGTLISSINENTDKFTIIRNVEHYELLNAIPNNTYLNAVVGDPIKKVDEYDFNFDLIVSCPPFGGLKNEEIEINYSSINTKIRDKVEFLIIAKACSKLSPEGTGLFVVTQNFFNSRARSFLSSIGIEINGVIHFPQGTFDPITQISTYLVILSREPRPENKMFLAEISSDKDIPLVLENWFNKNAGKSIFQGSLINESEFISFKMHVLKHEIERVAKKLNLIPIPLTSITIEIKRENKQFEDGFEEKPNSVYLPTIGKSDAVSRLSDLRIKPQNYIQIIVNNEIVSSEYLTRFFNSDLGKMIRESILGGNYIPKISLGSLERAIIYLPPIDIQKKTIELQNKIIELKSAISSIEQQLWNKPLDIEETKRSLTDINREKGFDQWIETLPFPIASILWLYNAEANPRLKKEHLFHFFEAFTQFIAMVLISGVLSDRHFFENEKEKFLSDFKVETLYRATFGTWLTLGERVSKVIRRELSNHTEGSRDRCLKIFKSHRANMIETLSGKKVFEILKRASEYRNRWKGHGGLESKIDTSNRLAALEIELTALREIMIDTFEGYQFIRPEHSSFRSGIYNYQVSSLMGTRPISKKINIQTTTALDTEILYLYYEGNFEPLELIPLVKFKSSPSSEENACYFYNSIDKQGVNWVSYHFDKEAEFIELNSNIPGVINILKINNVENALEAGPN